MLKNYFWAEKQKSEPQFFLQSGEFRKRLSFAKMI